MITSAKAPAMRAGQAYQLFYVLEYVLKLFKGQIYTLYVWPSEIGTFHELMFYTAGETLLMMRDALYRKQVVKT